VRINQLALALLHLFRWPLPEVFLERVLRPLGGGAGFAWRGYDDAWARPAGVGRVQTVPGGTHWGAGVSISARDQARIGQLVLDDGRAPGRPAADPARLDPEDEGALADRALLRPAALAERRRQGLPGRVEGGRSSWSAPAATTPGSTRSSTR
jgi:CubicO group peptidase (beta-lactamase class C family)